MMDPPRDAELQALVDQTYLKYVEGLQVPLIVESAGPFGTALVSNAAAEFTINLVTHLVHNFFFRVTSHTRGLLLEAAPQLDVRGSSPQSKTIQQATRAAVAICRNAV